MIPVSTPSFNPRSFLAAGLSLLFSGCAVLDWTESPTPDQRAACGEQCLANGERCSAFFAKKNEEQRLLFEQAKQNFWICLKKYPGAESRADSPCLAPVPEPEMYDSCGQQLDECLEGCGTSLEEVAELARKRSERSPMPTEPVSGAP